MSTYSDNDLLLDFQKGKEKAFKEVYGRFFARLKNSGMSKIHNKEEAEDIAIRSLNSVFRIHENFSSLSRLAACLNMAVANHCRNYHQALTRNNNNFRAFAVQEVDQDDIDNEFIRLLYESTLEALPPRTREVMYLFYEGRHSYLEIGDKLGLARHTCVNLRTFAIKKIKKDFEERGITSDIFNVD